MRLFFAMLCVAGSAGAQDGLKFDVVAIREVSPNAPSIMREQNSTPVKPGGQFIDPRMGLSGLIYFAYDLRYAFQLSGLPSWANGRSWSISAKPAEGFPLLPAAENREQVRKMVRAMLADRFHLQIHSETRQEAVYELVVSKGGIKVKQAEAPKEPEQEGYVNAALSDRDGRMVAEKASMGRLGLMLAIWLKRPVIDKTGLTGYYSYDITWKAPDRADGTRPPESLGADGIALLISTVQDRIGVQMRKTTGPVEYWVVDHVEAPSGN
jgi:uncharacterized protein (TIGR03435 family)